MAERYYDRPFPAEYDDRQYDDRRYGDQAGNPHTSHPNHAGARGGPSAAMPDGAYRDAARSENDPLAELARLIGQTDPFTGFEPTLRTPGPAAGNYPAGNYPAPEYAPEPAYGSDPAYAGEEPGAPTPPAWMRQFQARGNDMPSGSEPAFSPYATPPASPGTADPSRYDDVLYGRMPGAPAGQGEADYDEPAYPNTPYQPAPYDRGRDDEPAPRRKGGMVIVGVVLMLAFAGTAAAYGYRTYFGSPRSGEPPVIKAEPGPTKMVPSSANDANGKAITDRLGERGTGERVVSREEQPVEVKPGSAQEPRVVFPQLNQPNTQPGPGLGPVPTRPAQPLASVEPKRVRTVPVRGDQAEASATPSAPAPSAAAPAPAPVRTTSVPARNTVTASTGNGPMQLSPQAGAAPAEPRTEPKARTASASAGGTYMVQLSSQRSEADAQSSYRALQSKYPGVLGSRQAVIRRADLGDKGVYYRAMVGPFGSADEASQFCASLKSAGGQCVVPR